MSLKNFANLLEKFSKRLKYRQDQSFNMKNWAVLCIDMQVDFYENTEWKVVDMPRIIPQILNIAKAHSDRIIFTRFINPGNKFFSRWKLCLKGTKGSEIIDELKPYANIIFDKTGYSCMKNFTLINHLIESKITCLYFVGVETDACIYASMIDAFEMGFDVKVVEDAVTSSVKEYHEAAIKMIKKQFGEDAVVKTSDLLKMSL